MNDFQEIVAALSDVSDEFISEDGSTMKSGKTLGDKYSIPENANQEIKKRIEENKGKKEEDVNEMKDIISEYKKFLGIKTKKPVVENKDKNNVVLDVEFLEEKSENLMMESYIKKINKKY